MADDQPRRDRTRAAEKMQERRQRDLTEAERRRSHVTFEVPQRENQGHERGYDNNR